MRPLQHPAWAGCLLLSVCLCTVSLHSAAAAASRPQQHVLSWKKHARVATATMEPAGTASSGYEEQLVIGGGLLLPYPGQCLANLMLTACFGVTRRKLALLRCSCAQLGMTAPRSRGSAVHVATMGGLDPFQSPAVPAGSITGCTCAPHC